MIGRASGVRTEAQFNTVDRIVEKLVEPVGRFVNETTIASAGVDLFRDVRNFSARGANKSAAWEVLGLRPQLAVALLPLKANGSRKNVVNTARNGKGQNVKKLKRKGEKRWRPIGMRQRMRLSLRKS